MQTAIRLAGVTKTYPHFKLDNLSLTLPTGEIMGLVGVNGAGKSTTLRILMGLIAADTGDVEVLGLPMPREQVAAKRRIGYASDDMRLYPSRDLQWHMQFIRSLFRDWDEPYARHLLQRFDLRPDQKLKAFSHGERVKAALFLLLARRPQLLVLDEPTTGLDPVARTDILEELAEVLRDEGRSVLFSSHNTHDIEQLSDSITFLHDGRLLASEAIDRFLDSWRCIRCRGDLDEQQIELPGLATVKRNGSLIELKADRYEDSQLALLQSLGLEVLDVRRMSLEEIFIANVKRGKAP